MAELGGGQLEQPRPWRHLQWRGLALGVPSCPESPGAPRGGTGRELGHRHGGHFERPGRQIGEGFLLLPEVARLEAVKAVKSASWAQRGSGRLHGCTTAPNQASHAPSIAPMPRVVAHLGRCEGDASPRRTFHMTVTVLCSGPSWHGAAAGLHTLASGHGAKCWHRACPSTTRHGMTAPRHTLPLCSVS